MRLTTNGQQRYYFSDKMKKQLKQISQYPLTVVEAPSGFGKTTAIREHLRSELPQAACAWYTCMGESAALAWMEICALFARISSEAADDMKRLNTPTIDTLFYMKAYLKNLKCRRETYLVIDNYQLINFDMHRELISVFSMHENPNLHIIVITQQLDSQERFSVHNHNIFTVDASSFLFDRESISGLFRMEGFRLTGNELEHILKSTQGWISAIRLHMINYKETGSLVCSADIEQLVETAIWNRLMPIEKDFLLMVSVFDRFTARQAVAMLDYEALPGKIEAQLKTSDFIRFLPDKRLFIIHGILLDYLRSRFYYHQSKEYQNRIFRKAGLSCAAMEQYCLATKFFYKIRDFDAILSLPFTRRYLEAQKEDCEEALFVAIVQECPEEILSNHPATMLVFAHYALLNGQYGLYEKLRRLLRRLVQEKMDLTQEQVRRLAGELVLLESLGEFNDLSKMREGYEAASGLWGELPDMIESSIPWFSVFPTAFGMFWRESGKLDEMLHTIDELRPVYHKFSWGQGAGLGHLIRAEVMLTRGEDNEAEILCHKALYGARAHRQTSICIYAELCLARIFILRGDPANFSNSMGNIQRYAEDHSDASICRMVDICMSIIGLLLGVKDYVASWLYDIEGIRQSLYIPVVPFAELLHFKLLLLEKRYNELYAFSQLALDSFRTPGTKIKYMMPQMYYLIFLAVAKHNGGDNLDAGQYLKKALDIALPDQVYLPFADYECMTDILSGMNIHDFNEERSAYGKAHDLPAASITGDVSSTPSNRLAALLLLCKRQIKGVGIIKKALLQNRSSLTPREREIALLARERMSAKEIAAKLYISEKTVKSTLGSVYGKLEIHSRSELAAIEF